MQPTNILELQAQRQADATASYRHEDLVKLLQGVSGTSVRNTNELMKFLSSNVSKTELTNQLTSIGTPDALKVRDAVDAMHLTLRTHKNTDLSEVTKLLKSLVQETKAIPKSHPVIPEQKQLQLTDYTDTLANLIKSVNAVEQATKAQKLHVEAPVVNVPEAKITVPVPDVHVDAPDLKPITTSMDLVTKAVQVSAKDIQAQMKNTQTGLITEQYDEYRIIYEEQFKEDDLLVGIDYYNKGKCVCKLRYTYDDAGKLLGGKKV